MADSNAVLPTSNDTSATASTRSQSRGAFTISNLREDVDKNYADIPICLCSLVSGLCDSVAFNASSVFVSMQTGNTVFLALGAAHLPSNVPALWLRALCSIAAFMLGVFAFSKTRHVRPLAKGTLAGSFLVQALFIWTAAALAQGGVARAFASLQVAEEMARQGELDFQVLAVIILLAFQFGGQIVSSRQLGFNEVPTNVLTSLYCDLFSDPNILAPLRENPKRNRRVAAAILMFAGAVAGGWLGHSDAGMCTALWIGGAVKFFIAVAWIGWKVKETHLEVK
ncbi:hypothetical protein F5B20DRAFT_85028 [Whalleya microplaca]|nr:hypothetical protein F5B20DRAFT_85028 [Whalleya microplaca]